MAAIPIQLTKEEYSADAVNFSESGQSQYHFYLKGVGYGEGHRAITMNGTALATGTGGGMWLTVLDTTNDMAIRINQRYDIYVAANIDVLVAALQTIIDTDVFFMASYDAISTNANMDAEMQVLGSWRWPDMYNGRNRYICAGLGRTGIQSEVLWPPNSANTPAELTWNYQDYDSSGSTGSGPQLCSTFDRTVPEFSYTGTGYSVLTSAFIEYDEIGLADGEYITLSCELKVSPDREAAGGSVRAYINPADAAGATLTWISVGSNSTEWERVELRVPRNVARGDAKCRVVIYHFPSNIDDGTSYCRFLEVYKTGFSPVSAEKQTRFSKFTIGTPRIVESPGTFFPSNPSEYYKLWDSDKNLQRPTALSGMFYDAASGCVDEDVEWIDRTLTTKNEKYMQWTLNGTTTGGSMSRTWGSKNIDPEKMYYLAVWVKNFYKYAGSIYFGVNGYSAGGSNIGVYAANTGGSVTNPYQLINGYTYWVPDRWYLVEGWVLPHWTDNTYGTWVRSYVSNKEFGYVPDGGYHMENAGTRNVWRWRTDNAKLQGRTLDYYNDIQDTKTYYALPLFVEVKPLSIGKNGTFYSNFLREIL